MRHHTKPAATIAMVTAVGIAIAALQQIAFARFLRSMRETMEPDQRPSRRQSHGRPRWTGSTTASGGVSPVLPQHPHAATATGGSLRRAHIV